MASINDVRASVSQHNTAVKVQIRDGREQWYHGLDGEPSTISVVGKESEAIAAWEDAAKQRVRDGVDIDEVYDEVSVLVASVTDWSGWDDGENPIPCTPDNVRALLTHPEARHILRQVQRAVNNHHDFFGAASSGS
jgi:hypothetical protein